LAIAFLLGVVTNILTYLLTRNYSTRKDREAFKEEGRETRENTADVAVGHLRSSYLAVKKLLLSVLEQQRLQNEDRGKLVLWGITLSLEQIRLGLLGHMGDWKNSLPEHSDARNDIVRFLAEDVTPQPRSLPPALAATADRIQSPLGRASERLGPSFDLLERVRVSPQEMLLRQLASGDTAGLETSLRDLIQRKGNPEQTVVIAGVLASSGSELARDTLRDVLETRADELTRNGRHAALAAFIDWYARQDREKEVVEVAERLVQKMLQETGLTPEDQAWLANQLGKLLYGAADYARAVEWQEKAATLKTTDSTYACNAALCYHALGDNTKAQQWFERAYELDPKDAKHLMDMILFYREIGKEERAAELTAQLEAIDPIKARMVQFMKDGMGRDH
jgi:tetratricopeptide (TPR) repeat protein